MIESGSRSPDASGPAKLCDISTQWSLIFAAHRDHGNAAVAAQQILMERYFGAAYRYLLAIVREADSADDLAQEFALRFLRSGFQRLDPQRGRFRDYVIIHRARERFADLLLSEVERSLDKRAETDLESEMAELELLSYCKSALARRRLCSPAVRAT